MDNDDCQSWKSNFGSTASLAADGNGNGAIDAADYVVWRDSLGQTAGSGSLSNTTAPEPTTLLLLLILAAAGARLRRQRAAYRLPKLVSS